MTSYAGIDYSGPGSTVNRDSETGIRYGMISQNSLNQDAAAEVYYNGSDLGFEENKENLKKAISAAIQSAVEEYGATIEDADEAASEIADNVDWSTCCNDEPGPYAYEDPEGVKVQTTSNNELWVFKSPFYTKAQFCSPCVPGAGNLDCFCTDGPKTYCLPVDWFENAIAPYDIWSVETDELVWSRPVVES